MPQLQHMFRNSFTLFILFVFSFSLTNGQNSSLTFIENRGQWAGDFAYKAEQGGTSIFLEKNAFTYIVGQPNNHELLHAFKHGQFSNSPTLKYHAYKMVFENSGNPTIVGSKKQPQYFNYFLGNDPSKWQSKIHPFLALDYQNLYAGIHAHVSSEKGNLKYDLIVDPNANLSPLSIKCEGAEKIYLKENHLIIKTSVGDITEVKPYAYQIVDGNQKAIPCQYKLTGNRIRFQFPKGYDASKTLVIDPTVVFSTFTGSTADNWGLTATYDNNGNFYAGGTVYATGYPIVLGAFQATFQGGGAGGGNGLQFDMGISKFNANGTSLIYSTYLGGSDNEQPHSLIVDNAGELVVAGRTYSTNYPTQNAYDNTFNGNADIVLTKFNAAGTGLIGSTFLGGSSDDGVNISSSFVTLTGLKHNYGDDSRSEVMVDNANNVYLVASTQSANFPVVNPYQSANQGLQDAVAVKLSANLSSLTWSTYIGGNNNDAAYNIKLNNSQNAIYVSGGTMSSNFPSVPGGLWNTYQGGSVDGFILKFQNSGTYGLQKSTFIGRQDYDQIYGLEIDFSDNVYVMGQTLGGTFPMTAGVFNNPGSSQFVMKLNSDLTTNLLSTVFGSGNSAQTNISPVAFLVDTCNNIYISGWGGGLGFSPSNVGTTIGMPLSTAPNLPAQSTTDGFDFYFIVLSPNATNLLYSTYFGRNTPTQAGFGEHVDGGTSRFDKNGIVFQAICGSCGGNIPGSPYPTTPGTWAPTNLSANCNLAALKISFDVANLQAIAVAGPDTVGCPPFVVNFTNNSTSALTYIWDFGDGSPTTNTVSPTHTFTTAGIYTVRLVANNAGACNATADTTFITIKVDTNYIKANFDYLVTDSCNPYKASFTNTSQFSNTSGAANFTKFKWSFGDGSFSNLQNPGAHTYLDTGCYKVTLIMTDTTTCNKVDSISKIVCLKGATIKAAFYSPDSICLGTEILLSNSSVNAINTDWNFGNGAFNNGASPLYTYPDTGTYTITLVISNPGACNKYDSTKRLIHVLPVPVADFSFTPVLPVPNESTKFTNLSTNASSYFWSFGDGSSSIEVNPIHMYNKSGTYTVCLEAKNESGCLDTVCKQVVADITPAIGVPTGFSPNNDGENDILFVRGAAVKTVDFKVFNRFGELVFETKSMDIGWDGTYKGKPQEMEAYAWVLNATFIDGTAVSTTGNVTLLR